MIRLKSMSEIDKIRQAGRIVASTLEALKRQLCPGVRTIDLDVLAERLIRVAGAKPSFKGFDGYPYSICTSVNHQLAHGIPSSYVLQDGDLISIDIGAVYDGYHADSAWTFSVGEPSSIGRRLMKATEDALYQGIAQAKPGAHLSDISHAVQTCAQSYGFSIVQELTGHGVGRSLHEEPDIPNFGAAGHGPILMPGMVLAIEPLVNEGSRSICLVEDEDWTIETEDGKSCAHDEHTLAITENGNEILTKQ